MESVQDVSTETKVFWLIGFFFSTLCFIFQMLLYLLIPCSRKLDPKLLTQLTVARLLNVVFEYIISNVSMANAPAVRETVYTFYMQTDAALILWMFVFTKNLYEKVNNVFVQKRSFTLMSVTIWIVTLPIGLLCPVLLSLIEKNILDESCFYIFYKTYGIVKFFILTVNLLLFCKIFSVAITRTDRSVGVLRTCVVSFILVSISSVQVFLTDLLSFFLDSQPKVAIIFGVVNSYQVIAITTIFVILVHGACEDSLAKTMIKKICKQTV